MEGKEDRVSNQRPVYRPKERWKDQYTPLMQAVQVGSSTRVRDLVVKGANVNARTWQYDWGHYVTALDAANYNYGQNPNADTLDIVNFLTSRGAKVADSMGDIYSYKGSVI